MVFVGLLVPSAVLLGKEIASSLEFKTTTIKENNQSWPFFSSKKFALTI